MIQDGRGIPADRDRAAEILIEACNAGEPLACETMEFEQLMASDMAANAASQAAQRSTDEQGAETIEVDEEEAVDAPSQPADEVERSVNEAVDDDHRADLDRATIRRHIRRQISPINDCWEQARGEGSRLIAAMVVSPSGRVTSVSIASALDPRFERCLSSALRQVNFPPTHADGPIVVSYPFVFSR